MPLPEPERATLLRIAQESMLHGLQHGRPVRVDLAALPETLRQPRASFVTLDLSGALRGCIGSLIARDPLAVDVADNAFNAAFRDPRFPPVDASELPGLGIHISILSPPEPLPAASEADLLGKLRPGIDGLILTDGPCKATFLPAVWDHLPNTAAFVRELKMKAGLAAGHWSSTIRFERYTCECVP
jgi:AmmeMemoRadiSam system protein A